MKTTESILADFLICSTNLVEDYKHNRSIYKSLKSYSRSYRQAIDHLKSKQQQDARKKALDILTKACSDLIDMRFSGGAL
jgi:hypothetical protein